MKDKIKGKQRTPKMIPLEKTMLDIAEKSAKEDKLYSLEEAKLYLENHFNKKIPAKSRN